MVDDGLSKNPHQRKSRNRQDRESCINNIKLKQDHHHQQQQQHYQQHPKRNIRAPVASDYQTPNHNSSSTYTRKPNQQRYQRGSLENVSSNPWGDVQLDGQSSLRRTRSLAITREDIFSNLDILSNNTNSNNNTNCSTRPRRAQLIPRAKLIDRSSREPRYASTKAPSVENLPIDSRTITKRHSIQDQNQNNSNQNHNHSPSLDNTTRQRASRQSTASSVALEPGYSSINNLAGPKFIIGGTTTTTNTHPPSTTTQSEQHLDSLESNYQRGLVHNSTFLVSYEDLPGLSLPNYYPDSKYDDTDNTDNISITDNLSSGSSKKYSSSCDNISSGKWTINESESIPYDDNIVLSANKALYDSLTDSHYAKPKTIRGPTPYNNQLQQYHQTYRRSYSSDSSGGDDKQQKQFRDNNLNEINNNNEKIIEEDAAVVAADDSDINQRKKEINEQAIKDDIKSISNDNNQEDDLIENQHYSDELKIEEDIFEPYSSTAESNDNDIASSNANNNDSNYQQFKTIVTVEHESRKDDENNSEQVADESEEEKNKHSHNYLKEFLETQKGSKKPLQNFLTKKLSNLSRRNSKDINSNLTDNRFHSLPDITASKNLRKCEKIDRKLRKCDKTGLLKKSQPTLINTSSSSTTNTTLTPPTGGESRFIVNIGKHFDITANTNIPVDFELKIAKIPRKNKLKKTSKIKSEEQFLQAVKNLKQTLNNNNNNNNSNQSNQNSKTKPEIIGVRTKLQEQQHLLQQQHIEEADKEVQEITMSLNEEKQPSDECTKEYQEKLGTMRTYWDKIMNINSINQQQQSDADDIKNENPHKCKIVDVQTKIDDVKKKFEPEEPKEPEKPSKVQIAKQLFEKKPIEKVEKLSPFIKETCNYFESNNNFRENQFESLNPNAVEIISKSSENACNKIASSNKVVQQRPHKFVGKTHSVNSSATNLSANHSINPNYPEFDHVRYRVVKSNLFQKKIFANCEKESQFDGLMQYLQDYSFQELLRDNNIVIIEPIRTKVPHETRSTSTSRNITPLLRQNNTKNKNNQDNNSNLKRHFFYHPIRVNKEVNDDELPNPDTVKQVRQFFEGVSLKRSQSSQEFQGISTNTSIKSPSSSSNKSTTIDPDKDHCSATDSNSNPSNMSDFGSQENLYESITELCCEQQYVSEEILEKIREYGSTVTYYGGRVVKKELGQPTFTKAIMDEIKNNEKRAIAAGECSCVKNNYQDNNHNEINCTSLDNTSYQGVKFKLVKSNSCNSRLELLGTSNLQQSKEKYLKNKQKQIKQHNQLNRVKEDIEFDNGNCRNDITPNEKNTINENIKKMDVIEQQQQQQNHQPPRIIGEERKMTQWGDINKDNKTYNGISFNSRPKINYDYHNYDNVKSKTKKIDDMEFEQYEVA